MVAGSSPVQRTMTEKDIEKITLKYRPVIYDYWDQDISSKNSAVAFTWKDVQQMLKDAYVLGQQSQNESRKDI